MSDKPVNFYDLPEVSIDFIKEHFNEGEVSYTEIDKELFSKSYVVYFADGSKIEFDKEGNWEDICSKNEVPEGAVPVLITSYVKDKHPLAKIVEIERDKKNYEIELDNGIEIKFDLDFNVIDYDS